MVEKDAEGVSGGKAHFTLLDKIDGNDLMVQQGIIAGCAGGTLHQCDGGSPCTSRKKLWL